jgi:2-polyprenyl-3-methyl-5-hydroxy-6-metoxy-1,4-benzoquinol methylase
MGKMKSIVRLHFDKVAKNYNSGKRRYSYYYDSLKELLGFYIPINSKVYEVGCGTGDLIASLRPKNGYGMDLSGQMIKIAKENYKHNKYITYSTNWPNKKYDYIFMSDVIEHLENPQSTLIKISKLMDKESIFINTMANPIWEPLLMLWEKIGLKMPEGPHNRIKNKELRIMMNKAGLKIIKHDYKLLFPVKLPFITEFVNKYIEKPFKKYAFIEYFVAEKK